MGTNIIVHTAAAVVEISLCCIPEVEDYWDFYNLGFVCLFCYNAIIYCNTELFLCAEVI